VLHVSKSYPSYSMIDLALQAMLRMLLTPYKHGRISFCRHGWLGHLMADMNGFVMLCL